MWEHSLKELCKQIPADIPTAHVAKVVTHALKHRKPLIVICAKCGEECLAYTAKEVRYPRCGICEIYAEEDRENKKIKQEEQQYQKELEKLQQKQAGYGTGCNTPAGDFYIIESMGHDYEELKNMPYTEFLQTKYWKVISRYVKYRQKDCQLCGSTDNLNVHHKTYKHHGQEHHYWKTDLICLCRKCHKKFHNK